MIHVFRTSLCHVGNIYMAVKHLLGTLRGGMNCNEIREYIVSCICEFHIRYQIYLIK